MDTVQTFTANELPSHFQWQMHDFSRIIWNADISHSMDLTLHPERWHPTYFILAKGHMLISAATVLWKMVDFQESSYKVYGLGAVLTYPAHRKQGYGRQVVASASRFIQQKEDADFALLQTAPYLEQFYIEHGWEHTDKVTVLNGKPDKPIDEDGWFMMMFLSDHAMKNRIQFDLNPLYLDEHIW